MDPKVFRSSSLWKGKLENLKSERTPHASGVRGLQVPLVLVTTVPGERNARELE